MDSGPACAGKFSLLRTRDLYAVGVGGDHIEAWKLSFITGSWEGPYRPQLEGSINDYEVEYDPAR